MSKLRSLLHRIRCTVIRAMPAIAMLAAPPAQAQGDLLVAPTRVVIANGGGAEVVLSNIGSEAATYRIGLELRRMTEDGDIDEVTESAANPAEQAALAMVRFAPRRITLMPGQPQSVRISARPPEDLPDGEYRVHMSFRAIPPSLPEADAGEAATGGVAIRLVPVYGITIPVIVRKGQLEAGAKLANPRLVTGPSGTHLAVEMVRSGQRSTYGELIGRTGKGDQVFALKGVAIYPEVARRMVRVPLTAEQVAKLKGVVRLEYRELPENGGQLLAELVSNIN